MDSKKEKCFVIMPISDHRDYPPGHFTKIYEQIFKPAIEEAGYQPFRVDDDKISNSIIKKIFDAIQTCPMALCDLSSRNPNVLYELGIRQAYDKPVVLVQDEKTERIFDVSGINTVSYNSSRLYEQVMSARKNIKDAIISTRDGKDNSLIKVLRAENANLPVGELSKDDRIEIMINGLVNDVQEMKKELRRNDKVITPAFQKMLESELLKADFLSARKHYTVHTNKEYEEPYIAFTMRKIKKMGMPVEWNLSGEVLELVIGDYQEMYKKEIENILKSIGTIVAVD